VELASLPITPHGQGRTMGDQTVRERRGPNNSGQFPTNVGAVREIEILMADSFVDPQPASIPNGNPSIQDLVIVDLQRRKEQGQEKYGTVLQGFNGRDPLIDAYQEAIDLCQYLRQALFEKYGK
jgi:hypothetical protein